MGVHHTSSTSSGHSTHGRKSSTMSSSAVSAGKFVGTVSLGLLTGLSYSVSTLVLPTIMNLPSAASASHALTTFTSYVRLPVLALSALSSLPLLRPEPSLLAPPVPHLHIAHRRALRRRTSARPRPYSFHAARREEAAQEHPPRHGAELRGPR